MKKLSQVLLLSVLLLTVAACGAKKDQTTASSQKEETSLSSENSSNEAKEIKFTATLKENATAEADTIRLFVSDFDVENDPDNVISANKDGLVLNVPKDKFLTPFEEATYQEGNKIVVVLDAQPMLTRSMPPQVAGNSIISVDGAVETMSSAKVDVFTATLKEDARIDENHSDVVSLSLEDVKSDGDTPEDAAAFANQGAILNASLDNFEKGFEASEFKAGTKIRFTLKSPSAMTASIPPQVPGMSILVIEAVK